MFDVRSVSAVNIVPKKSEGLGPVEDKKKSGYTTTQKVLAVAIPVVLVVGAAILYYRYTNLPAADLLKNPTSSPSSIPAISMENPTSSPSSIPAISMENPTSSPSSIPAISMENPTSSPSSIPAISMENPTLSPSSISIGKSTISSLSSPTIVSSPIRENAPGDKVLANIVKTVKAQQSYQKEKRLLEHLESKTTKKFSIPRGDSDYVEEVSSYIFALAKKMKIPFVFSKEDVNHLENEIFDVCKRIREINPARARQCEKVQSKFVVDLTKRLQGLGFFPN